MMKIVFMLKRKPGVSPQQFRNHYENSHVKLAEKYIGHLLLKYVRNFPLFATLNPSDQPEGSTPAPFDIGYDAITEMWVPDEAAAAEMSRIFNDPVINPILVEDELKFLAREQTVMIVMEETESPAEVLAQGADALTG